MTTLLTGASGFLGREIVKQIDIGEIQTLGRSNADYCVDLSREVPHVNGIDLVIHCAGKAHVIPKTEAERADFFDVNVKGTENLLSGLSKMAALPRQFILISTVAVYGKQEGKGINEETPLKASDPYGQSKILKEQLVREWCDKHLVICSILRLPLLVGADAPGNLGAMIRGIEKGYYFNIGGGTAKKSMVLSKDVASVMSKVAPVGGTYNLTDGYHPSFAELSTLIARQIGKSKPLNLPRWMANVLAKVGDLIGNSSPISTSKLKKITSDLTFDDAKARRILNWQPEEILKGFNIKNNLNNK